MVDDGSKQVSVIDYTDNFAPVVKHTTVRMFLAIAAIHSMCVYQRDVESAFIYTPLHEDVYMHPHPAEHPTWSLCEAVEVPVWSETVPT